MIHSAISSTQNRWFLLDERLCFVARWCLLSLDLKFEAFDDEHAFRSRRESRPQKKTAREIENIAEENFEGLDAGGVFEFSMNG